MATNESKPLLKDIDEYMQGAFPETEPEMFACGICGRTFLHDRLKVHEKSCGKSTAQKKGKLFRWIPCWTCGRTFLQNRLEAHQKSCGKAQPKPSKEEIYQKEYCLVFGQPYTIRGKSQCNERSRASSVDALFDRSSSSWYEIMPTGDSETLVTKGCWLIYETCSVFYTQVTLLLESFILWGTDLKVYKQGFGWLVSMYIFNTCWTVQINV